MLKGLVINSLICSWLGLQRPCSELSALTPSSDPHSVPQAELRSAGHGCGITSARSHPGRFSSFTPGEAAGEATTAIPPGIWGSEEAGSEAERIPVPGDGTDSGRGAEAAGQAASRAGRHCRDAHPPGYTRSPSSAGLSHTPHAPAGPEVGARSGIPQAPAQRGQRLRQGAPSYPPRSSPPEKSG